MLGRLTEAARATVVLAECEARDLGDDQVGPDHLLLAIACSTADPVSGALADAGLDGATLRDALLARAAAGPFDDEDAAAMRTLGIDVEAVLSRLDSLDPGQRAPRTNHRRGRLRLSRTARTALQLAVREAASRRARQIGREHLLVGVLRSGDVAVERLVAASGADAEALCEAVLRRPGTAA